MNSTVIPVPLFISTVHLALGHSELVSLIYCYLEPRVCFYFKELRDERCEREGDEKDEREEDFRAIVRREKDKIFYLQSFTVYFTCHSSTVLKNIFLIF